jgi:hypothetical protein
LFFLVDQGFAKPIEHAEFCNGRICNQCRKCRDWFFIGKSSYMNWMKKVDRWTDDDWKTWHEKKVWEKFVLRDGGTCTYDFTYAFSYDTLVRRGYHDNNDCIDANNRHFGTNRIGCYTFDKESKYSRSKFSLDYKCSRFHDSTVSDIRSFCLCADNCRN